MRLALDTSALKQAPDGGTARYIRALRAALRESTTDDAQVVDIRGWRRLRSTSRRARPARRIVNVGAEIGWLSIGAPIAARRVHADAWLAPANVVPYLLRTPIVVIIHDLNVLTVPESYDPRWARYARSACSIAVRRARRVIAVSDATRRDLITLLGADEHKVRTVYSGVDHLTRVAPASDPLNMPRPYALFVGQTEPHKNVALLLDAWRAGVRADLALVICGPPGRDDVRLRELASAADLRSRVHFISGLDDAHLARLYADANCFLFPSLAEGFGFPPLEAMAHGIPTAVSTAGSLPEVTAEGAIHFDPRDPVALARLVNRLSDDVELRQRLAVDGRQVAGRYRWSDTASAVWEEVRHAIDG